MTKFVNGTAKKIAKCINFILSVNIYRNVIQIVYYTNNPLNTIVDFIFGIDWNRLNFNK